MSSTAPTTPAMPTTEAGRFADQLERSFRGGAWQGPSLTEALDGISAGAADLRPIAGAHSIRDLVFHVDFWIDAACRRIGGEAVDGLEPENDWPLAGPDSAAAEASWKAALAHLEASHRRLHAVVLALDDAQLDQPVAGSDPTLRGLLLGILQHNAYHTGQILLLAKAAAASSCEATPLPS